MAKGRTNDPAESGRDAEPRPPKEVVWLIPPFSVPPMTESGQNEAGHLLWLLQAGYSIGLPASRPMPSIGPRCHELRVPDAGHNWRIVYRIDDDAIVVVSQFPKKTDKTPKSEIVLAKRRLADYDLN